MEFSEKLKQLRSEKGISQAKLAADIHISRSAVAKWENGLGIPNDDSVQLIADYFCVTVEDLNVQSGEVRKNEIPDTSVGKSVAKTRKPWLTVLIIVLCVVGVLALLFAAIVLVISVTLIIGKAPMQSLPVLPALPG
ncbi:MAG: helix-turn-helix transcriptional regulator [Clostridia bacterium]|nr:helix-turn-helix transcriptional regulator [Clostridia bacterium]